MKTTKQHIENELQELGATFLLKQKKTTQSENTVDVAKIAAEVKQNVQKPNSSSKVRRMTLLVGSIAASILFAVLIFTKETVQEETTDYITAEIQEEDILLYLEDEISYFSDDENIAMMAEQETTNLFDNSGISDSYIEEYFINELNEEIQLEELL